MSAAAEPGARPRDLRPLFDPRSIAVLGASPNSAKWGYWLTRGALRGSGRRTVHLVNPSGRPVLGNETVPRLTDLPEPPELIVTAVSAGAFDAAIEEALECGVRGIIAINAGFAEVDQVGRSRQEELIERVRASGAMLVGPNCLGLMDNSTELEAAWLPVGHAGIQAGPMTVVSQSGNLGLDLIVHARERQIGISRFISIGNQGDVSLAEFVHDLATHEETEIVAIYCEDVGDGRALFGAVGEVVAAGKQVLVIAAGGSEASTRAARSHTGSMASPADVIAAACRDSGAIHVPTPEQLMDVAQLVLHRVPGGRRIALLSDGGGHAVFGSDVLTAAGLEVRPFSAGLSAELAESIPSAPTTSNPIDLGGAIEPTMFERAIDLLAKAPEVDGIVVTGGYGQWPELDEEIGVEETESAGRIAAKADAHDKSISFQTFFCHTSSSLALRAGGIPLFRSVGVAADAYARALQRAEQPAVGIPPLPDSPASRPPPSLAGEGATFLAARELLAEAGVRFPTMMAVVKADDAVRAAADIGYPVTLKATGSPHKSDAGGVALDLTGAEAVRSAFEAMSTRGLPGPFVVEAMVDTSVGVELILGCRRDPHFGPVLMIGLGGIYTELLGDKALTMAPAESGSVRRLLGALRGAPLLRGLRGQPPVDEAAVAAAAVRISTFAAENLWVEEVEINPLLATPEGTIALDAHLATA